MKNIGSISLLNLLLITSMYGAQALSEENYDAFLVSFPFSGSHWLMYTITKITGKFWTRNTKNRHDYHNFHLAVTELPLLFHSHNIRQLEKFDLQSDKMILLIRSYKEIFIRFNRPENIANFFYAYEHPKSADNKRLEDEYFKTLEIFDQVSDDNKLLVYYEDLMTDPVVKITEVITFLGGSQSKLEEFLENLEKHQNKMIAFYEVSLSKGKDLFFHSKKVSKEVLLRLDSVVEREYPYFFEKYLQRYKELEGAA